MQLLRYMDSQAYPSLGLSEAGTERERHVHFKKVFILRKSGDTLIDMSAVLKTW